MSATVSVNGRTVVHAKSAGQAIAAAPDVCKTPAAPSPLPIPYPNIALSSSTKKGSTTVTCDGKPVMLKSSEFSTSSGDEAGTAGGGVVSSKFKGKAKFVSYSFDVKFDGKNVARLADPMTMNGNAPNTTTPAEVQAPVMPALTAVLGAEEARKLCEAVCEEYHGGRRGDGVVDRYCQGGNSWFSNQPNNPNILPEATFKIPGAGNKNKTFVPTLSRTTPSRAARTVTPGGPRAPTRVPAAMGRNAPGTSVRWDLISVSNPNLQCRQANVSAFIELKGDNETYTRNQLRAKKALKKMPKPKPKLIKVTPSGCGCPE